jgi:hypothetical protein
MSQYPAVIELSSLDGNNGFQINGEAAGDQSGFSVASAGDDTLATVTAIDSEIDGGALKKGRFDADMSAAVDSAHLAPHHAVIFVPNADNLAGKTFLVIDVNGVAGYQGGEDLVVQLFGAQNLGNLGTEDFI